MAPRTGSPGHGDGDGVLETCVGGGNPTTLVFGCETVLFWNDLSFSGLIEGNFTLDTDSPDGGSGSTLTFVAGEQSSYLPNAKIGNNNSVAVFSLNGQGTFGPAVCGRATFCYALIGNFSAPATYFIGQAGITPRKLSLSTARWTMAFPIPAWCREALFLSIAIT